MHRILRSKIKECYLRNYHGRHVCLTLDKPVITFTFDDFPVSAYKIAGSILEENDSRGTYYTSMGLMGCKTVEMGEHFTSSDITEMLEKGHEIGCHTYSHLNYNDVHFEEYIADISRNKEALADFIGGTGLLNFSFPFGYTSLKLKRAIEARYNTCRGIFPGINAGTIDLNLLRANKLYSNSIDIRESLNLIEKNKLSRGWLIFYTHDVSSSPSLWGCTPEYFSDVVNKAASSGSDILTIKEAYERIC